MPRSVCSYGSSLRSSLKVMPILSSDLGLIGFSWPRGSGSTLGPPLGAFGTLGSVPSEDPPPLAVKSYTHLGSLKYCYITRLWVYVTYWLKGPLRLGDRHWDPKIQTFVHEVPRQTTVTIGNLGVEGAYISCNDVLANIWMLCIQQRKTVGTYGYPSTPVVTPVTNWIDNDEPPSLSPHAFHYFHILLHSAPSPRL